MTSQPTKRRCGYPYSYSSMLKKNKKRRVIKRGCNKYHNKKIVIDGITFDSTKEGQVYVTLKDKMSKNIISDLKMQPRWVLQPKLTEKYIEHKKTKDVEKERTVLQPIYYTADFSFMYNDKLVVIDVKGSKYTISKDFPLRIKMLKYHHNLDVHIVYSIQDLDRYN